MIVIFLILLFILIPFVIFSQKRVEKRSGLQVKKKARVNVPRHIGLWLLLIYSAVMCISLVITWFLPFNNSMTSLLADSDKIKEAENAAASYYYLNDESSIKDIKDTKVIKHWNFHYSGKRLSFNMQSMENAIDILAEKKGTNDGTIEVYQYTTPQYIGDLNITEKIKPQQVNLYGSTLSINSPKNSQLKIAKLKPDLTVSQFNNEKSDMSFNYVGVTFLYLRIPNNLQLQNGEGVNIRFIGKSHVE